MEVSDQLQSNEPGGPALIQELVTLTGLPENLVQDEIDQILEFSGQPAETLTLDSLRQALLTYLEALEAGQDEEASGVPQI